MGFIHLQMGYRPQIPILSALYPQLTLLNPPEKIPGYATVSNQSVSPLVLFTEVLTPLFHKVNRTLNDIFKRN
jgi:hypothetical protein